MGMDPGMCSCLESSASGAASETPEVEVILEDLIASESSPAETPEADFRVPRSEEIIDLRS